MPRLEIPNIDRTYVDFDANDDKVKGTIYYQGEEVDSIILESKDANEEGISSYKKIVLDNPIKKEGLELWIHWPERRLRLVYKNYRGDPVINIYQASADF
ncbi:TPA: hypothetical protein QC285_003691 [Bacillus cereus]|uniref:hypothetical protein n=1 Tax=Bacillus cereus TaxID=1396 RepID=UPI002968076F|nr:hypothetical protein [Bacillus cereus]MED2915258.1 hypothetical protein [Bacillus thuringiensis]MCU4997244.1 hypothetical protein [Bacillus cereus]MED2922727.1 hypothetical protein [Bacillus thuringiensis]MED3050895.1 hypothetical protein [Bacillus thuringiensis]